MNRVHFVLLFSLVSFGAINTILLKLQNAQTTQGRSFFHPLIQTICMFLGETLVGIAYWVSTTRRKRKQQLPVTNTINTISEGELFGNIYTSNKPKHRAPILIVILPTLMDLLSTLLSYIALNLISSSVWQMSRGGNIIVTAILSRLFLQHKFTWSGIFGCVLAFIGISSVQLINILLGENNSNNGNGEILGTILLVASICFNGLGLVLYKYIFNKYELSALKLVFLYGIYGFIIMCVITYALQYVQCPEGWKCVKVYDGEYLENFGVYFGELAGSWLLVGFTVGLVLSIAVSVPIAVSVSKSINPVSRALADVCRTVYIWVFGIVMTVSIGVYHEYYRLYYLGWLINILKLLGFLTLVLGTLMYHGMFGCCHKTKLKDSLLLSEEDGEEGRVRHSESLI